VVTTIGGRLGSASLRDAGEGAPVAADRSRRGQRPDGIRTVRFVPVGPAVLAVVRKL
jgi:hypothetical protein